MLKVLTLDEIKKQVVVDEDYHGDDEYLEMAGESAEDTVEQLLDMSLDELAAKKGDVPATIRHAMRMLCDYFYAVNRGSADNDKDIPQAVYVMIKLYRQFN